VRVKLDENLDARLASVATARGHDVETVATEGLSGQEDDAVFDVRRREERTLITPDPASRLQDARPDA